ncbi:MAG: 3-phosphoshikimate 1-carboxyvinyltransferase [Thermincola sp.]|nr:3-phosphoshikimate 1-carboxyvinyltransferase [Thermincola sp.]MDT3703754.1 3-phosphoshikimate 1-carboxyvinyltransferase [Thermincola sp.]
MDLKILNAKKLCGQLEVPGDKSISHRAVMLGSLAGGITRVKHFLMGADCLSTIECFRAMGAEFTQESPDTIVVKGKGLHGLDEPQDVLNVGNSGTTIRLMSGILAGQKFFSTVTGDASIRKRPMGRVAEPLRQMGARIWGRNKGSLAPLAIQGGELSPINFASPVASAQVKSSILLAGLYANGQTIVSEPQKSRDHSERMLAYLGADLEVADLAVKITGNPQLEGREVFVPGDISSAAYFMVAAAVTPGADIRINRVGINPTRTGIIDVLRKMGATIQILNEQLLNEEPVGDILVKGGELRGIVIDGEIIPRLIDEIPVITVAAAMAQGETLIRDAGELKVKETNRIATVISEFNKMGAEIEELPDGMRIKGATTFKGAVCDSHGDHRIAMSLAVAGLLAKEGTMIRDAECIDVSFPGFERLLLEITQ